MRYRAQTKSSVRERVALTYDRSRRGHVVAAGPEQSEVQWDGERGTQICMNRDLVRVVERARSKQEKES